MIILMIIGLICLASFVGVLAKIAEAGKAMLDLKETVQANKIAKEIIEQEEIKK